MTDDLGISAHTSINKADLKKLDSDIYNILTQFEKTREWADLTNCLIKLNRILRNSTIPHIPYKETICKRLAQCLNHQLPTGVHTMALEVYSSILDKTPLDVLSKDLALFSTGLFPFFSYSSYSIRPQFLEIIDKYYIPLGPKLIPCLNGLLICIIPGLEDDKTDFYELVYNLVEKISNCIPEECFMRSLWLIFKKAKKIRLPTLFVLSNKLAPGVPLLPKDRIEFLLPDKDELVLKSLISATRDDSVIILRELINFMSKHFPLNHDLFSSKNKAALCLSILKLLRNKDWSLTRRIYQWLFNTNELSQSVESIDLSYFNDHSKGVIIAAIRELLVMELTSADQAVLPLKIIVTLISDIEVAVISDQLMPVLCIPILRYVCDAINDSEWHEQVIQETKIIFNPTLTPPNIVFVSIVEQLNKLFTEQNYHSTMAWVEILDLSKIYLDEIKTLPLCETVLGGLFMLLENALLKLLKLELGQKTEVILYLLRYVSAILVRVEAMINGGYEDYSFEMDVTLSESTHVKHLLETQTLTNQRIGDYLDDFYIRSLYYFEEKRNLNGLDVAVLDMLNNLTVRLVAIETNMHTLPIIKSFTSSPLETSPEPDAGQAEQLEQLAESRPSKDYIDSDPNVAGDPSRGPGRQEGQRRSKKHSWTKQAQETDQPGAKSGKLLSLVTGLAKSKSEFVLENWMNCLLKCCLSADPAMFSRAIRTLIQVVNIPHRLPMKEYFGSTMTHVRGIICHLWKCLDESYAQHHSEIVYIILLLMGLLPDTTAETEKIIIADLTSKDIDLKINAILRFGVLLRYLHSHLPDEVYFADALGYVLDAVEESDPKLHYYARAFLSESIYMLQKLVDPILHFLLSADKLADHSEQLDYDSDMDAPPENADEQPVPKAASKTRNVSPNMSKSAPHTASKPKSASPHKSAGSAPNRSKAGAAKQAQTTQEIEQKITFMTEIVRKFRHLSSIVGREGQAILDIMNRRQAPIALVKMVQGNKLFNYLSTKLAVNQDGALLSSRRSRKSVYYSDNDDSPCDLADINNSTLVRHFLDQTLGARAITFNSSILEPSDAPNPFSRTATLEYAPESPRGSSVLRKTTVESVRLNSGRASSMLEAQLSHASRKSAPRTPISESSLDESYSDSIDRKDSSLYLSCDLSDSENLNVGECSVFPRLVDASNASYTDESIYNYLDLLIVITLKYICIGVDLETLLSIKTAEDLLEYERQLKKTSSLYSTERSQRNIQSLYQRSSSVMDLSVEDNEMLLRCTAIDFMKSFVSTLQPANNALEVSCLISKYLLLLLYHFNLKQEHIIQTQMIYLLKVVMDRCSQEYITMSTTAHSLIELSNTIEKLSSNKLNLGSGKSFDFSLSKLHISQSIFRSGFSAVSGVANAINSFLMDDDQPERSMAIENAFVGVGRSTSFSQRNDQLGSPSRDPHARPTNLTPVYIMNMGKIKRLQMSNLTKLLEIKYFSRIIEICIANAAKLRSFHLLQSYIDLSLYSLKYMEGMESVSYASSFLIYFSSHLLNYGHEIGTTGMFYYLRALYFMFNHLCEGYATEDLMAHSAKMRQLSMSKELRITKEMTGIRLFGGKLDYARQMLANKYRRKKMLEFFSQPHFDITNIVDSCVKTLISAKRNQLGHRAQAGAQLRPKAAAEQPKHAEPAGQTPAYKTLESESSSNTREFGARNDFAGLIYMNTFDAMDFLDGLHEMVDKQQAREMRNKYGFDTSNLKARADLAHFDSKASFESYDDAGGQGAQSTLAVSVSLDHLTSQVIHLFRLLYLKLPYHFVKACIYIWDQSNLDLSDYNFSSPLSPNPESPSMDFQSPNLHEFGLDHSPRDVINFRVETKTCLLMLLNNIPQITTNSVLFHTLDMMEMFCKSSDFRQLPGYLILNTNVREVSVAEFLYTVLVSKIAKRSDVGETWLELQRWINLVLHFPKQPSVFLWLFCAVIKFEKNTTSNYAKILTNIGKRLFSDLMSTLIQQACSLYSSKVCNWLKFKHYDVHPPVPIMVQLMNSAFYLDGSCYVHNDSNCPELVTPNFPPLAYKAAAPKSPHQSKHPSVLSRSASGKHADPDAPVESDPEDQSHRSAHTDELSRRRSKRASKTSLKSMKTTSIDLSPTRLISSVTKLVNRKATLDSESSPKRSSPSHLNSRSLSLTHNELSKEADEAELYGRVVAINALSMLIFFNYDVKQHNRRTPITNVFFQTFHKALLSHILPLLLSRQHPQNRYFTMLLIRYFPHRLYQVPLINIKKNLLEFINSSEFFNTDHHALRELAKIFKRVANEDFKSVSDLISRLDLYTNPPHLNVFANKTLNLIIRLRYLKRLAFVLYACEHDAFSNYVSNIIERLADTTRSLKNDTLRSKCLFVMRVLLVKTSQEHLNVLWPVLLSELIKIFRTVTDQSSGQLESPHALNGALDNENCLPNGRSQNDSICLNMGSIKSDSGRLSDKSSGRLSERSAGRMSDRSSRMSDRSSGRFSEKASSRVSDRSSGRISKNTTRSSIKSSARFSDRLTEKEYAKLTRHEECPNNNKSALLIEAIKIVDVACALKLNEFLVYQWMFIDDLNPQQGVSFDDATNGETDSARKSKLSRASKSGEKALNGLEEDKEFKDFKPFLMMIEHICTDKVRYHLRNTISLSDKQERQLRFKNVKNQQWDEKFVRELLFESIEREMLDHEPEPGENRPIQINQIYKTYKRIIS